MARKRPTASDVPRIPATDDGAGTGDAQRPGAGALTEAQGHALRRCAPLTPDEFKAQREVIAQQHRWAVMRILRRAADRGERAAGARPRRLRVR